MPDRAEDAEVVGVRQFGVQCFGCRQDGAVAVEDVGEDGDFVSPGVGAARDGLAGVWWCWLVAGGFFGEVAGAGEFGCGAGAGLGVGVAGVAGDAVGVVGSPASGHGDVEPLPVAEAVDEGVRDFDGAALGGVDGGGVGQIAV